MLSYLLGAIEQHKALALRIQGKANCNNSHGHRKAYKTHVDFITRPLFASDKQMRWHCCKANIIRGCDEI